MMGQTEIQEVNVERLREIIRQYIPRGRFLAWEGHNWVTVDNSAGDTWTEEFQLKHTAIRWLNGQFEIGEEDTGMNYTELKDIFQRLKKKSPLKDLTAHITFTEDSFSREYSLLSRTYRVSSDNKGFWPRMFSRSIFAYCLDVTSDQGVRLDWYMAEEGNPGGWKVEECYILEQMQDAAAIPSLIRMEQDDRSVCYFFGDTCIQARKIRENGKIRLESLIGKQSSDGEWVELTIDRIYGYCTLLERHLNRTVGA